MARGKPFTEDQTLQRNVLCCGPVCRRESHVEARPHTTRALCLRRQWRANASLGTTRSSLPFPGKSQRGPGPQGRAGCLEQHGSLLGYVFYFHRVRFQSRETPVTGTQPMPRPLPALPVPLAAVPPGWGQSPSAPRGGPSHSATSYEGSTNTSWMKAPILRANTMLVQ